MKARGLAEVVALARSRAREFLSSDERLIVLVRPTGGDGDPSERADMVVKRATPEDASIYERDIGTDSRSTFRARLSESTTCYLVMVDDRAVHATWCTTAGARTREIEALLIPPAGDAYVYESYTRPEVRGRGVYPYALGQIAADLSRHAVRHVWVAVEGSNAASLRAVAKAGFEPRFAIGYRRRWGRIEVDSDEATSPESLHLGVRRHQGDRPR